jgi:hypothetical protein
VVSAPGNEIATSNFGHSRVRVPEWLHIGAHPHAFPIAGRLRRHYESPAIQHIRGRPGSETGLIAIQKVVGSNPISRFDGSPAPAGLSASGAEPEVR